MSLFHQYPQPKGTDSPEYEQDSDTDLPFEDLDPLGTAPGSSTRSQLEPNLKNGHSKSRKIDKIHLHSLNGRPRDKTGHGQPGDEDQNHLLDHDQGAKDSAGSLAAGDDDAPLLQSAHNALRAETGTIPRKRKRKTSLSDFFIKLRSTPRSELEESYDPARNRTIDIGRRQTSNFPPNAVSNAKYTPWSFLPRTLYNEFSFFFNLYFLLVALSQIIPPLRIGYLTTYIAPLAFVLAITLGKEAYDDITRRQRDAEANSARYTVLVFHEDAQTRQFSQLKSKEPQSKLRKKLGKSSPKHLTNIDEEEANLHHDGAPVEFASYHEIAKMARDLRVGDVIKLGKDQRIPADCVILKIYSGEANTADQQEGGEAFIRTDQLDGETDWKLRLVPALTQSLANQDLVNLSINAGKPDKKVNEFVGTISLKTCDMETYASTGNMHNPRVKSSNKAVSLSIDNTAWANTVLASSASVLAAVVYTGPQTRQALSTSASRTKNGLLENELNSLTKILCILTLLLSVVLVALDGFRTRDGRQWYIAVMRFLILFSTIVPISLRVNLDMGKSVYAWFIQHDVDIPETVVRTGNIPEDLGRIEYLLSDKTGTLTQNEMVLKKIHVGTVSYANDAMSEVSSYVRQGFSGGAQTDLGGNLTSGTSASSASATRSRREIGSRVRDVVLALALCHNVTPTVSEESGESVTTYQASSPDEIAIVRWTEMVGLRLAHRDRRSMLLESTHTGKAVVRVEILHGFPFTSEGKRMGIVLRFIETKDVGSDRQSGPIWFFQKGADTVMSSIVASNDWLDEETANMAREGLRTLVVGRKKLSTQQYEDFSTSYKEASMVLHDRDSAMANVVKDHLEQNLELLGVTGVEDRLQQDVKPSLELLRNAGIKIWMLTGDKVETARCVAVSSRLVARGQYVHTITKMNHKIQAQESLELLRSRTDACLLIDGESLALMLTHHRELFISTAVCLSAVIACRCSPTQKAEVAQLIRAYTQKRVCCIGDGGNDVSMIQAADVGVGIVGKEGKQASLAADFSILQFAFLTKLLVWHGRNSYKRSAKLAQFVMHRGLIISVCQAIFSIASKFEPIALYKDWLLVGYATVYTMGPVFSLVLDTDIPPQLAHLYPELYAELSTSRSLSYRTFFIWVAISLYQGLVIQLLSDFLVGLSSFPRMVSVSYTVLIINELVMVAAEVTTWHWIMVVSIIGTAGICFGSLPFLGRYYDLAWILTLAFWWRVAAIAAASLVPVYVVKIVRRTVRPPSYRKVQQGL